MNDDVLALKMARRHVKDFNDESDCLIREHREAMECLDCEAFLQIGIDAFQWLTRADLVVRKAIFLGKLEYDPELDAQIAGEFRKWLGACDSAKAWMEKQIGRGYKLDNLDDFRECEDQVRAIVESMGSDVLTEPMRELRDRAITEHRNGETAEFVSTEE